MYDSWKQALGSLAVGLAIAFVFWGLLALIAVSCAP